MQAQGTMQMSQPVSSNSSSNQTANASQSSAGRDFPNTALLCKVGQETIQDIVSKSAEMFNLLKMLQLPNGTSISASQQEERKVKLHDLLRNMSILFKRLHRIYERCNEYCDPIEQNSDRPIVPFVESDSSLSPEPSGAMPIKQEMNPKQWSDTARSLKAEYDDQLAILREKNAMIKQMMDSMRELVWDINTMLAMHK